MPTTNGGYDLKEVLSALQKDIRRGRVYPAMFWAVELETFNNKALWNRLRVIASEDISMANPALPLILDVLEKQYYEFKKAKKGDMSHRLFLANAILALCRSSKSRIAVNLVLTIYGQRKFKGMKLKIPDYALDGHTLRGAMKGRSLFCLRFLQRGSLSSFLGNFDN